MHETQARRAAAFAVVAGGLATQFAHVVASAGQLLGVLFAPTAHAAASVVVIAGLVGALFAGGVLAASLRHALQPGATPSVTVGVLAVGLALVSYVASVVLGAVASASMTDRIDAWATSSEGSAGDAVSEYVYATSGAGIASGLLSIAFAAIALGWLGRSEAGPRT